MLGPFLARFFQCVMFFLRGAFVHARPSVTPPTTDPTSIPFLFSLPSPIPPSPARRTGLGYVLPAYLCAKVLAAGGPAEEIRGWATYWTVFSSFCVLEWLFLDRFLFFLPLFPELKVATVVWLWHPATRGAAVVWRSLAAPALHEHGPKLDAAAGALRDGLASAAAARLGGVGASLRARAAGAVGRLQAVQAAAASAAAGGGGGGGTGGRSAVR
jgi:hypothetical protein